MRIIKTGITRHVILIGTFAIKVPHFEYGWEKFLFGLLGNMQETRFSKTKDSRLCPILFSMPGGFLNIARRAELLDRNITTKEYKKFKTGDIIIPVEKKSDSFGFLDGKLVAIDYGS